MHTQVSMEFDEERRLNDELDDREAFEYELFQTSQLRVCACCGQERNGLLIPDKVLLPTNNLFTPLCGDLVLIPGEPIRLCICCADVLKTGRRPKWAIRFPPMDTRFTRLTPLEFRLVRPIVPVISLYQLPGGEGQYATIGGSVSYVNDCLTMARRLPRPLEKNGAVWLRNSRTTNSQVINDIMLRPDMMRDTVADCIATKSPSFSRIQLDTATLANLAAANVSEVVVAPLPASTTPEEEEAAEKEEAAERNGLYGPDSKHVLLMDVPEGVNKLEFLRTLFSDDKPNVPGEAEARPGDAGMLTRDELQPLFPEEALLNDIELGRKIFMLVFPQHFTNGKGGLDEAPDDLTESEFIECCLFYHTRQFAHDNEFIAFSCK
jgi:hypothetical protein